jgi:lantibiotic modifying enzyme
MSTPTTERGRLAALRIVEEIVAERGSDGGAEDVMPLWAGPEVVGDEQGWSIVEAPVGAGLYSGSAGIALALASAVRCGAQGSVPQVALAAARHSLDQGWQMLPSGGGLDLAAGASGIAYAGAWVGWLLDDPDLLDGSRALARATGARMADWAPTADYLTGASGAVVALQAVCPDDSNLRDQMAHVVAQVAGGAHAGALGVSWPSDAGSGPGLLGLAHGAAGTAWALRVSSLASGDEAVDLVAQAALDHERGWFDPSLPGWPDLRPGQSGVPMTAWCHGALGIGIVRLAWLQTLPSGGQDDDVGHALLAEVGAAVEAARQLVMTARAQLRDGQPTDCCLCHGLVGVVELLISARDLPGGEDHARALDRLIQLILEQRRQLGFWPCGLPERPEPPVLTSVSSQPPGLFLGRCGIAMGLLRADAGRALPGIALPTRVPG